MGSQTPVSIPNYAAANNVGQVQVKDQHNHYAPINNAKARDISSDNNQRVNLNVNFVLDSHNPRPLDLMQQRWPEPWRDKARFAQRSSSFSDNYSWSVPLGDFASADENARSVAEIQRQWRQSEQSVKKLNRAVLAFQSCGRRNESEDRGESDDSDDTDDTLLSEIVTEDVFREELEEAIRFYNRGSRRQSPVLVSLRAISADMDAFLSWLALLRDTRHRSSVFFALKNIIEATRDKDKPHDDVMETVAATVCAFKCGLEDYLSAMRTNRLTAPMEGDTIEIFESMVAIFVPLLKRGRKKLRSPQRETIEDSIKRLGDGLSSAKAAAKRQLQQTQQLPYDNPLRVPRQDELGLYTKYIHNFLQSDGRPAPLAHPVAGEARLTRSSSMIERDAGSIPAETLIRYLGYDAKKTAAEIDQCFRRALPNPTEMPALTTFTQGRQYRSWLTEESKHSALLIQGELTAPQQRRRLSPLSYLCARLAHDYANDAKVVVLCYFCDLHEGPGGPTYAHLLCQLIGQLLSHPAVARAYAAAAAGRGDPIFDRHWEKKLKARDAGTLVKVFSALVRRLRACELVVFCLVDAIAKLETTTRVEKAAENALLSELRDLVQERKRGRKRKAGDRMVFKLLVSAGATRVAAESFFDTCDIVDLVADVGFPSWRRA